MSLPKRIEITEVGPRDGWQNHKAMIIPTEVKAKYVKKMIDAGADKIEVTSFVNPKAVPQMANAKDLVALVQPYAKEKGCQTIGLALNKRGVDDAVAAGGIKGNRKNICRGFFRGRGKAGRSDPHHDRSNDSCRCRLCSPTGRY